MTRGGLCWPRSDADRPRNGRQANAQKNHFGACRQRRRDCAAGVRRGAAELPKLAQKATYKVGFAQTESNNPWRMAQTASMKDEAAEARLDQLVYTDAAGSAAKQVADVNT